MNDIYRENNREVIFYGIRKDVYGQSRFTFIEVLPSYRANKRTVGYVASIAKQRFPVVYAISNSEELKMAWHDLARHSHRGAEDSVVFEDFLEYLVRIGEGMKF